MAHRSWPVSLARRKDLPPVLVLRSVPPPPPLARSAILWGDVSVARLAVRTAAAAVDRGIPVAIIDGAMAFDVTMVAAYAQARRIPPERFLRQIHIARAFTCHQVATLLCERLDLLLATQRVGLVILLGPCTTFFDENVPFKDAFLLFRRAIGKLGALCKRGPCCSSLSPSIGIGHGVPYSSAPSSRSLSWAFAFPLLKVAVTCSSLNRGAPKLMMGVSNLRNALMNGR